MQCPNCKATVLKGDRSCRKCGTMLGTAKMKYDPSQQVRPRLALVFRAWFGACYGMHLKWLGFDAEAQQIKMQFGINITSIMRIYPLIMTLFYHTFETLLVILGKYRTDSQGHPIRYFNFGKAKRRK